MKLRGEKNRSRKEIFDSLLSSFQYQRLEDRLNRLNNRIERGNSFVMKPLVVMQEKEKENSFYWKDKDIVGENVKERVIKHKHKPSASDFTTSIKHSPIKYENKQSEVKQGLQNKRKRYQYMRSINLNVSSEKSMMENSMDQMTSFRQSYSKKWKK